MDKIFNKDIQEIFDKADKAFYEAIEKAQAKEGPLPTFTDKTKGLDATKREWGVAKADGFDELVFVDKYDGTATASGLRGKAFANGDWSSSAVTGKKSAAISKGYRSTASSNGDYSISVPIGQEVASSSNGDSAKAFAKGPKSRASCNGLNSKAVAQGDLSRASCNGNFSIAAVKGCESRVSCNGDYSKVSAEGYRAIAMASGFRSVVKGSLGSLLMAAEYRYDKRLRRSLLIGGKADIVDGKKLKPNCWYMVEGGEWVEMDISDGIYSYVLFSKGNVKKVREMAYGSIMYVITDEDGNSAHGKTLKEAKADLLYKQVKDDFDGEIPDQATGLEWASIYRSITGACQEGIKIFAESTGKDINKQYTKEEILEITKDQYRYDEFFKKIKEEI